MLSKYFKFLKNRMCYRRVKYNKKIDGMVAVTLKIFRELNVLVKLNHTSSAFNFSH